MSEHKEPVLYLIYREFMVGKYGPGPWLPSKVDPKDRWREWVKQWKAAA